MMTMADKFKQLVATLDRKSWSSQEKDYFDEFVKATVDAMNQKIRTFSNDEERYHWMGQKVKCTFDGKTFYYQGMFLKDKYRAKNMYATQSGYDCLMPLMRGICSGGQFLGNSRFAISFQNFKWENLGMDQGNLDLLLGADQNEDKINFRASSKAKVFRYNVKINFTDGTTLNQGGCVGNYGKKELLRDICYQLIRITFERVYKNTKFVFNGLDIIYTNSSITPMSHIIRVNQMDQFYQQFLNNDMHLELEACQDRELDLNNVCRAFKEADLNCQFDPSLCTFLEMLTSQAFINNGTHRMINSDLIDISNPEYHSAIITMYNGVVKKANMVQAKRGICAALTADIKTYAFFAKGNLGEIADTTLRGKIARNRLDEKNQQQMEKFWSDFEQLFKGISAYLKYNPTRIIVIGSMTKRKCSEISFIIDGRHERMVDFFHNKKNININPNWPAVRHNADRDVVFPLECLEILPFQRLTLNKMSLNEDMEEISQKLLTRNSISPENRFRAIENEMCKIQKERNCAQFMQQFNIELIIGMNDVPLIVSVLPLPDIKFGNGVQKQDGKGRFDVPGSMNYLEPSKKLKKWIVAYPNKISIAKIRQFIENLEQMAYKRKMDLPKPVYEVMEKENMAAKMQEFYKSGEVRFLTYIDNKHSKSHATLKLFEQRFSLITQHITIEMISKNPHNMTSNVLNKMNMKLFGLNYMSIPNQVCTSEYNLESGNLLVIGYAALQPPRSTGFEIYQLRQAGLNIKSREPVVVGFCANFLQNTLKFAGDYIYQPHEEDYLLIGKYLFEKTLWMLRQAKANNRCVPKTIFIIRDCAIEGMPLKFLYDEYNAFVEAFKKFMPKFGPKFIFCIVDKSHNKRFFQKIKRQNNDEEARNIFSSACVEEPRFLHINPRNFFLQANCPLTLKETTKIPQYIFPVNEPRATSNALQAVLHQLCNMWQIVNFAPTLPSPVLQARELAKRGQNNFMELLRSYPEKVPYAQGQGNQLILAIDFTELNKEFTYQNSPLVYTRFNA